MKKIFLSAIIAAFLTSCSHTTSKDTEESAPKNYNKTDTIKYPYKARNSSDLVLSSHPEYVQKILTVWKMYETNQVDKMRPYFADTVTYDDAKGNHYNGTAETMLEMAQKEIDKLDSLRFDISMWESVHSNDKNEDWVNIWSAERTYPKNGKPDTTLICEKWMIKDGKINYFNQYSQKLPKLKQAKEKHSEAKAEKETPGKEKKSRVKKKRRGNK